MLPYHLGNGDKYRMSDQVLESEILNASITSLVCDDGEIYFKAKDVATALRFADPNDAIQKHVWEENKFEWCVIKVGVLPTLQGMHPRTLFITEPGTFQLNFASKLPSASAFQRWVFPRFFHLPEGRVRIR